MIPEVFVQDLGWLALVLVANWQIRVGGWARGLLRVMAVYVATEMLFHRVMEDAVARLM